MPLVWILVGAFGSYFLSDKVQQRWQKMGATYEWMTENEERFNTYLRQRIYQLYLSGELQTMLEEARKAENILEPPPDYIKEKEAEILAHLAGMGNRPITVNGTVVNG